MKVVALTTEQQTQAAALKATVTSTQTAAQAARVALQSFLNTAAGITPSAKGRPAPFQRVSLTDDGTSVVVS
jgi:hypothetical protein